MQIKNEIKKLLFQNIFLPLSLGIVSAAFILGMLFKVNQTTNLVQHTDTVIQKLTLLQKQISDAQVGARGYILSGNATLREPFDKSLSLINVYIIELESMLAENNLQSKRISELDPLIREWFVYIEGVLENYKNSRNSTLAGAALVQGERKVIEIRNRLQELLDEETRLKIIRNDEQQYFFRYSAILFLPLLLLVSLLISFRGRASLLYVSKSYENKLIENQRQLILLETDHWLSAKESELSNSLVNSDSLTALSNEVILFFIENFGALAGVLYVKKNQKTEIFERISSIGLNESKESVDRFSPSNTLLAKVILTQNAELFTEFPESVWNLKSGLGTHRPRYVFAAPVTYLKKCVAVLEISFNQEPDKRLIEFINQTSEKIGSLVSNQIANDLLQDLIEDVQQKSEELQSQQEELRVSNEELEERAQLLRESQNRLQLQNNELEESNKLLQQQACDLEEQKAKIDQRNQELIQTRNEISRKTMELERISQYKSQFLANMSHELRTPLNSTMILAQLLSDNKEKNLTPKQIEFSKQILKSGQDLLALINDILDLSKVESGMLDLNITSFPLADLVHALQTSFQIVADSKGIQFEIHNYARPKMLKSDRLRLQQVLGNLISNALKFTTKGKVTLEITDNPKRAERVLFSVKDTGIGIPKNKQRLIFEPFKQADESTSRKFGGTGLGLSISKQLSDLLGGTITLESEVDQGSTFTLDLPINQEDGASTYPSRGLASHASSSHEPLTALRQTTEITPEIHEESSWPFFLEDDRESTSNKAKILVIEDDRVFATVLRDHIREKGFNCIATDRAQDGLALAISQKPLAIVLDINLPDYSGLYVLEQLKANLSTRHIPVHMFSAEDFSLHALKLGAAKFHLKPVTTSKLKEFIDNFKANTQQTKKLLLIEDDENQAMALKELLAAPQLEIEIAKTGKAAKDIISSGVFLDCIILDLKLPDMSGVELLRGLSEEGLLHNGPPIIIHTGADLSRAEENELSKFTRSIVIKGNSSQERLLDEVSIFLHQSVDQMPEQRLKILEKVTSRSNILKGQKILLVDDDLRNVFALTAALEQKGANIEMAQNGLEAVQKLKKDPNYDIVLMDIMMPVMDGYEAIQKIRDDLKMVQLPIIALTAKAMKNDRELCIKSGANDYLSKPIDVQKLTSLIRVWTTQLT